MTNNKKVVLLGVAIVAILVVGVAIVRGNLKVGGNTHFQKESFLEGLYAGTGRQFEVDRSGNLSSTGTLTIGSTGTALDQVNAGTCYIWAYAATIAASSTAIVDCQATAGVSAAGIGSALTGVTSGDKCILSLATTTAGTTFLGVRANGATASTTFGSIQAVIANGTGGTFTWPTTGTATGTASYICTR